MIKLEHLDFDTFGICTLSVISVRLKPDMRSELVTQLLFGECFCVFEHKRKQWIKIQNIEDNYIGWIDQKQCRLIDFKEVQEYSRNYSIALELSQPAFTDSFAVNIGFGSHLPGFDGISFKFPNGNYNYSGQAISPSQIRITEDYLQKIARKFLYAPHMYGGKSVFGIDSSGFIQLIFKAYGISLPRDSMDQVHFGEDVHFFEQCKVGDLAFFEDADQNIEHVGMIIKENKIIHVNGRTRIDFVDHNGIYIKNRRKYTHKLRVIKRILEY